ncbi:hypothetical protein M3B61_11570 [Micrococcus luteus]|nr:hypothetical protein [Micrococcus yunnanensis]MCT1812781.1 hypothetical protein [Micrococcus luteus]
MAPRAATAAARVEALLVTHDLVHLPRMHGVVHVVDGRLVDMAEQRTA